MPSEITVKTAFGEYTFRECIACRLWNHWHDTLDGSCEDPRCECPYRPGEVRFT
jgi:hypothetical protein